MTRHPSASRIALVPLVALALAACSNDDSSADATTAAAESALTDPAPSETTAAETAATNDAEPTTEPTGVEPTGTESIDNEPDSSQPADPEATDESTAESLDGVLTDIVADATGGRSQFDGEVDELADLEALVADAWGDGGLGIHRGHAQIENVLEAFLGIDHDTMHVYMDDGFNLAELSIELGRQPDALVESLTNSYTPFVVSGVDAGVITDAEAVAWVDRIRTEFRNRVDWDG